MALHLKACSRGDARQLLETATGEEPEFTVVEREVLRFFRRVHLRRELAEQMAGLDADMAP